MSGESNYRQVSSRYHLSLTSSEQYIHVFRVLESASGGTHLFNPIVDRSTLLVDPKSHLPYLPIRFLQTDFPFLRKIDRRLGYRVHEILEYLYL
jgi:hypothetical protein